MRTMKIGRWPSSWPVAWQVPTMPWTARAVPPLKCIDRVAGVSIAAAGEAWVRRDERVDVEAVQGVHGLGAGGAGDLELPGDFGEVQGELLGRHDGRLPRASRAGIVPARR